MVFLAALGTHFFAIFTPAAKKEISALEKSLQMTPNDTDLRITKNLMSAYLLAERLDQAIELGYRNLERKNSMIFTLLAYAEAINGNQEKARGLLDQQLTFHNAVSRDSFYQQMAAISDKDFLDKTPGPNTIEFTSANLDELPLSLFIPA